VEHGSDFVSLYFGAFLYLGLLVCALTRGSAARIAE